MGRHNHENDMVIPGGWEQIAVLSGDDTFFTPPFPDWSQLYLYLADNEDAIAADQGSLWAFRVTGTDEGKVDEADPFNGANDYGEIQTGDVVAGAVHPRAEGHRPGAGRSHPPEGSRELGE